MSTILERILSVKREEIAALAAGNRPATVRELLARCADLPPTRGFVKSLVRESVALIAEVKKASPSKGVIRADFDPVEIAKAYERGGAACLSVLTDREFFQGEPGYLMQIREAVSLPLLRKDFLIDPLQVYEARVLGADAVLLIVAATPSPARLAELRMAAESVGLDALVEVHNESELALAVESGASLIGVNNRDLHTFNVTLETAESLIPTFPEGTLAVAESGIFTPEDRKRMAGAGASAILVGEALMRQSDIEAATKALLRN
jgi:indole-3-glycerol phosphate synthase